jgi:hypothetical protein
MLDPDAAIGGDAHVLEHTIIDESQRLASLYRSQEDQPTEQAGARAILFPRDGPVIHRFVDHVGLHPNREVSFGGASFHRAELVVLRRVAGRNPDIDARSADRLTDGEIPV